MSTLLERTKSFYRTNPWKGRLILSFVIFVLILSVIRITLPQTIIYSATSWLEKQGIESSIEKIDIDIIDGTISLINAKGSQNDKPLFNVGLVEIHWEWAPLSDKKFDVTKIALDKFSVDIEQYKDAMIIGGVRIPVGATDAGKDVTIDDPKEIQPWAAALGKVVLSNFNICYLQHSSSFAEKSDLSKQIDYCVTLEEMSWSGTINYATDKSLLDTEQLPLTSRGDFLLRGLTVTDNKLKHNLITSASNHLIDVVINGLHDIHIDQLDMENLSAMQRDDKQHLDTIRFQQLTVDDIRLSNLSSLAISSVTLSHPGLYLVKQNQKDWEYMQWLPPSPAAAAPPAEASVKTTGDKASPFTLTLKQIAIDNSDFCYRDKEQDLYYCFTLDEFNWDGTVNYNTEAPAGVDLNLALEGDLSLTHPNLRNHQLQRNLLGFQSLALNRIKLKDGRTLSLKELILTNFNALQRSEKTDDNTLSFDDLKINDIGYSVDNITVNTIKLSGLAAAVSKNKDGQWEFDKWRPVNVKESKDTKASTNTNDKSPANNKPLLLSFNDITVNSNKAIIFTDNSTEPTLKVGLQKLLFDIKDLNSARPETDSAFKLQANTTRHSTIDLKGTARPFAEKVSVNADGKLKGFDLRAASPATKQAIGHIIKSGQLDADLKLRATEGILDSNIALSLYNFNIKPMSKKDADALDSIFGMPLNQTLVLLRDRDGNIHLDIPITGDISNPDFNPTDAIIKATSKAASVTLITFFTPYGLIYAGGNVLLDLATALNFDPIQFQPGSSELIDANKEQLDKLAKLMADKPQIHLTLCGMTNQSDLFALYPEVKKSQGDKDTTTSPLTAEQTAALKKLAMNRQVIAKDQLINAESIAHDRLILCEPEPGADKDAIAGVEVSI